MMNWMWNRAIWLKWNIKYSVAAASVSQLVHFLRPHLKFTSVRVAGDIIEFNNYHNSRAVINLLGRIDIEHGQVNAVHGVQCCRFAIALIARWIIGEKYHWTQMYQVNIKQPFVVSIYAILTNFPCTVLGTWNANKSHSNQFKRKFRTITERHSNISPIKMNFKAWTAERFHFA